MNLAILCSGQGGQHADMFRLTASEAAAAPIFADATQRLGFDPRSWIASANDDALFANRNAQMLCVVQALAIAAALRPHLPERICVAGYSVGEMAAWGVAQMLPASTTLALTLQRATCMDDARQLEQGLLALRGLSREKVESLLLSLNSDIAIRNPSDSYVIGGTQDALHALAITAKAAGATTVRPLRVHIASHTCLMSPASARFREALTQVSPSLPRPGVRMLSGVDGDTVVSMETGKLKLAEQISHTIDWEACLQACVEAGCTAFLEFGPGRALASMATEIAPGIPARSVDDFKTLDGIRDWLNR
jgi:[acyl-carrier-protein] S-malonyltransferase